MMLPYNHAYGFPSAWFDEIKDEYLRNIKSLPIEIFPVKICIYLFRHIMFQDKSIPSNNHSQHHHHQDQ